MQGRFTILSIVLVVALLVALNAASYVRVERPPDSELTPDRSTLNAGATGTRALYDFLQESGYKVIRWREPPATLLKKDVAQPATFVVVGKIRVPFKDDEIQSLLRWVEQGGRLIMIDRTPEAALLLPSGNWRISANYSESPVFNTRADDPEEMTRNVSQLAPIQPTRLTRDVGRVAPSRFASRFSIAKEETAEPHESDQGKEEGAQVIASPEIEEEEATGDAHGEDEPEGEENIVNESATSPPPPRPAQPEDPSREIEVSPAPVVHLADDGGAVLIDYVYGKGRITALSDPFIVTNNGISRADNLQLAINIVTDAAGIIAFDEYHQGRGETHNRLLAYFAGTPVPVILGQAALIVLAVMWTHGRRFALPLPAPRVDRRSKLEFVASMAELQQRARAYSLALENIYGRTRRALARYGGTESTASPSEIAARVAARSGMDQQKLESLMRECEETIAGESKSGQKALALAARLREVEHALGIRMRAREIRQAEEHKRMKGRESDE